MTAVPYTAWEQAVFVCLIIVLVLGLLAWMSRETKSSREFQKAESEARDRAQAERDRERDKAQAERDSQWRQFFRDFSIEQANRETQNNAAVLKSLDGTTASIQALAEGVNAQRAEFREHDQREWAAMGEMSRKIHEANPTQPRRTAK